MTQINDPALEPKEGPPEREGVKTEQQPTASWEGYHVLQCSNAASLADLAKEYALFSHAALFVYGNWPNDPVRDYILKEDPNCTAFWLEFDKPIFSGLSFKDSRRRTNSEWNYRLMACPLTSWPGLLKFFMELQGYSLKEKRYCRTLLQRLPMTDYYKLAKKPTLTGPVPTFEMYTIGLDGNDRQVYFEPASNPPIDKLKIRFAPPENETKELANKILNKNLKPLLAKVEKPNEPVAST